MTNILCFIPALLLLGCTNDEPIETPDLGYEPSSPVTSWPTFTGDCKAPWNHVVTAVNMGIANGRYTLLLQDTIPGKIGFRALLSLEFRPEDIGVPLSVERNAERRIGVDYQVVNTIYSASGAPGMIQGTVTVNRYQPPDAAEFVFSKVTLVGDDSQISGTFRCGIDGTLRTSFQSTALGTRCQTDDQCGGAGSERVCDNTTFVCTRGCHNNDECAVGKSCDTKLNSCR